ncbi:MAG: hypothetical protein ALAOOOJD_04260 [bacterium]|nr:hypothetical protein [bacterium]
MQEENMATACTILRGVNQFWSDLMTPVRFVFCRQNKLPLYVGVFLFMLSAGGGGAQAQSGSRLTLLQPVLQPGKLPILNHAGERLAWCSPTSLQWSDQDNKRAAEIKGTFLKHTASFDGNAIAVLEKMSNPKDGEELRTLAVRWLNRDGRQLCSYRLSQHEDDPLPQLIFNAAGSQLLMANAATARLIWLNANGQVLHEVGLFGEVPYLNERPLFPAAANDVFVVLSQPTVSTTGNLVAPVLICFSLFGEERWRRELAGGTAGNLAISADGNWIAASRYFVNGTQVESTISVFTRDGESRSNVNGQFRRAIFANDGRRLLLMDRRQLRMLSLPPGELLWEINLSSRSDMFADIAADVELTQVFALVGASVFQDNRFVFEQARILGFNENGKQQVDMPIKTVLSLPKLAIANNGQRLTLAAEGFLQDFTISK